MEKDQTPRFSLKLAVLNEGLAKVRRYSFLAVGIPYLLIHYSFGTLMASQVVLVGILCTLSLVNKKTREFALFLLPIVMTILIYDGMKYFSHIISANTHVIEPYLLEKNFFGFLHSGALVTPNEFFQKYTHTLLDLICGSAYILYIFEFIAFACLLYFSSHRPLGKAAVWSFFLVNMMGYLTYYFYPAAPPWYVSQFGLTTTADLSTLPSAAGALRFDQLLERPIMANIYANGSIVFGSIPSLHVTYPLLAALFAFKAKKFRIATTLFYLLVAFSAVYLNHHYITDVIIGSLYAVLAVEIIGFFAVAQTPAEPASTPCQSMNSCAENGGPGQAERAT